MTVDGPRWRQLAPWWLLSALVVAALLVLPLAPALAQDLRLSLCRAADGCGYRPPSVRCDVLSRDFSVASGLVALRRNDQDGLQVERMMDGSATVTVTSGPQTETVYSFGDHDGAIAWTDRLRGRDERVVAAATAWHGDGLRAGVRRVAGALGFPSPVRAQPAHVTAAVPSQVSGGGSYLQVTAPAGAAPLPARRLARSRDGSTTVIGALPGALAGRLGLSDAGRYELEVDAASRPRRLTVHGEAAQSADGTWAAAQGLTRLRERGASNAPGRTPAADWSVPELRHEQHLVLDLRSQANLAAVEGLFLVGGPVAAPRPPTMRAAREPGRPVPDPAADAAAVDALVARLAVDAVMVRATHQPDVPPAGDASGANRHLVHAFAQDFAVPTSVMTTLPGCSR